MPDIKKWSRKRLMIIPVVVAVLSLAAAGVVAAHGDRIPALSALSRAGVRTGSAHIPLTAGTRRPWPEASTRMRP